MIENLMFILLWFILPFLWLHMMKASGLNMLKLSIPSFVIAAILFFNYIGLPILYFELDSYRALFVTDKYVVRQVFFYTSITISLMVVGFMVAHKLFGSIELSDINLHCNKYKINRGLSRGDDSLNLGIVFFSFISLIVLYLYLQKVGRIALFESDFYSSARIRSLMTNAFSGKYHWYKVFMNDSLVFLTYVALANALITKRFFSTTLFITLFLSSLFVTAMTAEKAPLVFFLAGCFLVYISVVKKYIFSLKYVPIILVISLSILAFFYFRERIPLNRLIPDILSRAWTGQIQAAYHYLEYFSINDFLLGKSFPNPRLIFPFTPISLPAEIMNWARPDGLVEFTGVQGTMPTIFWGEMYGNFGILGVLIFPGFVGFGLYGLNKALCMLKMSPLIIGFFVWLLLHFKDLALTGLSSYFIDIYLFVIVIIFIILYLIINTRQKIL